MIFSGSDDSIKQSGSAVDSSKIVVNYDYDDVPSIGWEFAINEGEENLRGNMTLDFFCKKLAVKKPHRR